MNIINEVQERSGNKCELCSSTENLSVYEIQPPINKGAYGNINACSTCLEQIEDPEKKFPKLSWTGYGGKIWRIVSKKKEERSFRGNEEKGAKRC